MARRPFFSGNYGSALGSTANAANIIARAGEQQGQRLANMGAQIGGMIQQEGLNKEKQKENKATIKSSIGILQRMSKIDEANAPQYMAQIQQLENEDVPLSQRGMLADKTLQGLSITNQLQGQMLSNQGKQQALGLARQLEASTIKNAELQNINLGFRNDLAELTKRKGEAITPAEIKSILDKYDEEQKIRPSETAAKIATNELTTETAQASKNLVPLQTADKKGDLAAKSTERKIADEVIEQSGGIPGIARKRLKAGDLSTANIQSQIDYRNNMGLAQLYKSLAEKNPTFEEQFTPLAALQDKLRGLIVKTPKGESVTYAEYEKLHNKEPGLYPMNNEPGAIRGQIESVNLQIYNLSREQPVQVNVPEEPQVSASASTPTNLMGLNYDYSNLDPSVAELMAGPGAVTQQITDPAIINMLRQGGTIRGKNLEQLIAEGAIIGQ